LKIHVIGIGDTGAKITQEMCSAGHTVNAVDVWKNSFEKLPPELVDTKYINIIHGDGNKKDIINVLNIETSDLIFVCTGNDSLNGIIAQKISTIHNIPEKNITILVKDIYIENLYRSLGFLVFNKIDSISNQIIKLIK